MYGRKLAEVKRLSFRYAGSAATPNSPGLVLPLDRNGDGAFDHWVLVAAHGCNEGAGMLDAINDRTCAIQVDGGADYKNWATLGAALPHARVAPNQYFLGLAKTCVFDIGSFTLPFFAIDTPPFA